jgi:hypothetical protein
MVLVPDESLPRVILPDYDAGLGRFRLARAVLRRHALAPDVHERVARRLAIRRRASTESPTRTSNTR